MTRLKRRRLELGLSQQALGRQASVPSTTISVAERGLVNLSRRTRERLAAVLNVSVDDLLQPDAPSEQEAR
jgi:transcriptional regulator with XRE-family HTH domain